MEGIYFPGLGILLKKVISAFHVFGLTIPVYAVIVTASFLLALFVASKIAMTTGQNDEDYLDFFLVLVIPAILGARIYYILFNLDRFVQDGKPVAQMIKDMINIRNGGLAVYGGLIAGVITGAIFAKVKKLNFPLFGDTIAFGVVAAQILGRWGNFFNRECFGGYYAGRFRMAIPVNYYSSTFFNHMRAEGIVTKEMLSNQELVNGIACITVHPTFLYEGIWNLILLIFLLLYRKKKKFDGEIAMLYVAGYGIGRFLIEGLRTDALMVGPLKVSQVVAAACVVLAVGVVIYNRVHLTTAKVAGVSEEKKSVKETEEIDEKKDKEESSSDE